MSLNFADLFGARSAELTACIAATRSVLWHPGQKGAAVEGRVRDLIGSILPSSLAVTEGFLYDLAGNRSPQCDVIIYDRAQTPIVFSEAGTRAIPIECAFGVVEVKSRLDARALYDCHQAMVLMKSMAKVAFGSNYPLKRSFGLYDPPIDHFPLMYYVFAFEGASSRSIARRMKQQLSAAPSLHEVINAAVVLNSGTVGYHGMARPNLSAGGQGWISVPTPGARVAYSNDQSHLTLWLALVLDTMLVAEMYRPFNFIRYLQGHSFSTNIL